jgi:hypothetical protein
VAENWYELAAKFQKRKSGRREALTRSLRSSIMGFTVQQTLSKQLADIVLPDSDGREVRLGSLWESKPAVIVFLRHYG